MRCPLAQCQEVAVLRGFLRAIWLPRLLYAVLGLAEPSWFGSPARVIRGSIGC